MALINRFLCWKLRTACFLYYILIIFTTAFALAMRIADLWAIASPDFQISRGFSTMWRTHFWQAFLASDVVLTFFHVVIVLFSLFMIIQVRHRHFVMYMLQHKIYIGVFITYMLVELAFSVFEYSYYGMNTFRLSFVVFTWLFWMMRNVLNIVFVVVMIARKQEMAEQMDMELRYAGQKKRGNYYA
ncbi:uncharacterized protein LOC127726298 [Mytilus californianus]|uniref:uncharacterized protein LOC127726298 n=1 Tax=Mytilus californianus TaxID=6549 RepID=UPI002246437C|nr:uncharacterized protein LOC127726298 [Mytilus californianus]